MMFEMYKRLWIFGRSYTYTAMAEHVGAKTVALINKQRIEQQ